MPWIETIPYEAATGSLREAYDRVKGPGERVEVVSDSVPGSAVRYARNCCG